MKKINWVLVNYEIGRVVIAAVPLLFAIIHAGREQLWQAAVFLILFMATMRFHIHEIVHKSEMRKLEMDLEIEKQKRDMLIRMGKALGVNLQDRHPQA